MPHYIEKLNIIAILKDLVTFENELKSLFERYDMDLRENLGRRNALISALQEKVTAKYLRDIFIDVKIDGAPGKPDILINDIDQELECKITSGSKSKGSVSYSLQTDYETICKKEVLDYMYILCNEEFDKFCVLFFEGLTSDDFFYPAAGSRGKSRMYKKNAMKKCKTLLGSFVVKNEEIIKRYEQRKSDYLVKLNKSVGEILNKAYDDNMTLDVVAKKIELEEERYDKKVTSLDEKIKNWQTKDPQFSFIFESLPQSEDNYSSNSNDSDHIHDSD